MNDYTVGLALYDFFPSLFTGIALFYLARMLPQAAHARLAALGGGLVVLAGVLKATWKLIMATSGTDIVLFSEALFPLMGPGFFFVALAVWASLRSRPTPYLWRVAALVAALAFVLAGLLTLNTERGYFPVFLMLASLSNVALSVMLINAAVRRGRWLAGGLFFVNIAMVFALQPIAQMPDKSIAIHWFEQSLTTGGAAAFALAAFLLYRTMTATTQRFAAAM